MDAPPPPTDGPERQYRLLRQVMAERSGFQLLLVIYLADAGRDRNLARLTTDLDGLGVDHLVLDLRTLPADTVLLRALMALLAANPERDGRGRAISVIGLEAHLSYSSGGSRPEATDLLPTANFQRDAFPGRVPVPVALWGTALAQPAIANTAPDLWHWRVGGFDLSDRADLPRAAVIEASIPRPAEDWQRQSQPDARRRQALLEQLLAEDDTSDDATGAAARRRSRLLFELGDLLVDLGDLQDARKHLDAALAIDRRLGDARNAAVAMGRIADILQDQGQLVEALRIRKDEELPVYRQLGDVRAVALTMGRIADVFEMQGNLTEALRIRQDEELPVYRQLGDVRAVALTRGQIADVLEMQGNLTEALRIRQEEELPVYRQLGDVRAVAITRGKIADVLEQQGQLAEALRIRQDEQLPVYRQLGDVRAVAITRGKIADVLAQQGQLTEALRIYQEEALPVYRQLGDVRQEAMTRGRIADVLAQQGQPSEGLRIRQEEVLPVYRQLGDRRNLSICLFAIARARLEQGLSSADDATAAIAELAESFRLALDLQAPDGISNVGRLLAPMLAGFHLRDEALEVLDTAEAAAQTLGDTAALADIADLRAMVAQMPPPEPPPAEKSS